jgi:hypothetical protein
MNSTVPSNRSFGILFTAVFAAAGVYGLWRGGILTPWMLALAAFTAAVTLARPVWLAPFNRAWMQFGALLHRIVSPVVLGLLYFGMFTPIGWVMRLAGHDAMARRWDPSATSYWIRRAPPGPADDSFRDLF